MHHSIKNQFIGEIQSLIYSNPKFIFSTNNEMNLNGIPVFVFHTIEPGIFESQLLFLLTNGYKTLSIDEFYNRVANPKSTYHKKSVLLTIDDARSSVWRFAFPLLKKYQMNATLFIIPGLTMDGEHCRNNLVDVWEGRKDFKNINEIDPGDSTLCNWHEIIEMYNSNLINIESHTLFHNEVFNNSKIVDFITNDKPFLPYNYIGSPYLSFFTNEKKYLSEQFLGLPIFETAPLMLCGPKLNISSEFVNKCKDIYNYSISHNISKKSWKKEIRKFMTESSNPEKYFYLEPNSQKDVYEDLKKAREIIQGKLDNNAGNHLCLPWTIGNNETINVLKELGIKSCFWGVLKQKKINKPGDDPYFISRIKNDFIFRLPGKGRKKLFSIYNYKLKRRISKEPIF
jgi:peptidoglycan/xylan/chitin deacetylase (PgdA/CDA1 family)